MSNAFKVLPQKVTADLNIFDKLYNKEFQKNMNFHNKTYCTKRECDGVIDKEVKSHDAKDNFQHLCGLNEKFHYITL